MREVIIYSRRGCHLCEVMMAAAEPLSRGRAEFIVRDVDTREDWLAQYGMDVPVLMVDGQEVCRHQLDEAAFVAALNT